MINYVEKGHGLHIAIQKAGHSLREENGVWISSDDAVVQGIIDDYDAVAGAVKEVRSLIDAKAAALRNKITAGTSPAEMASWGTKIAEAEKFFESGLSADAPALMQEANARGVALSDVVNRVSNNAKALMALEATIAGNAGKHKDALAVLITYESVLAYDWSSGWPVV